MILLPTSVPGTGGTHTTRYDHVTVDWQVRAGVVHIIAISRGAQQELIVGCPELGQAFTLWPDLREMFLSIFYTLQSHPDLYEEYQPPAGSEHACTSNGGA